MIVGGYSLHLYCDNEEACARRRKYLKTNHDEFFGETASECRRKARQCGWKVDTMAGTALCPDCAKVEKERAS